MRDFTLSLRKQRGVLITLLSLFLSKRFDYIKEVCNYGTYTIFGIFLRIRRPDNGTWNELELLSMYEIMEILTCFLGILVSLPYFVPLLSTQLYLYIC